MLRFLVVFFLASLVVVNQLCLGTAGQHVEGEGLQKRAAKRRKYSVNKVQRQTLAIVGAVDLTVRLAYKNIVKLLRDTLILKRGNRRLASKLAKMDRIIKNINRLASQQLAIPPKFRYATICEGKKSSIKCRREQKIDVIYANYGRSNRRTCGGPVRVRKCRASQSFSKVSRACSGRSSCQLTASNKVFGDPCKGTRKYLRVKYQCLR